MPNFASCHHAMRASRVAICFWSVGVGAGCAAGACAPTAAGMPRPSALVAANAAAPAAPNCFKNDRLVLSLHSIAVSFSYFVLYTSISRPAAGRVFR